MEAFVIIILLITLVVINATLDNSRIDKKPLEVKIEYPTKEEYEENIKKIRSKELQSDRFEKIVLQ